ncbi:MAG TPA: ATP-binding protein [Actinophytocola sp.]|uniref:ATP-binding protein n=1 Tax=Actinophytocola sp. TaxID=1872138 RepID=UPI002DB5DDB1|nr:ATP-binding protein [Actinophytocola sp.]HEU5472447.1 ATP-binding protein [Actinophytocola sp.]
MSTPADVRLTLPAAPESLEQVYGMFETFWVQCPDIELHERIRFETATVEIANNISKYVATDDFSITLADRGGEIEALFEDSGPPLRFDPRSATMPDELAESGRGLALACAAVDEVHYHHENHQNIWRLVLRRGAEHTRAR